MTAQALTPHTKKYSDDSAMDDLSNSDSLNFAEVEKFSNWCRGHSFDLNVKKTKVIFSDFRKVLPFQICLSM